MLDSIYYVFDAYDRIIRENLDREDRFYYSGIAFEFGQIGENLSSDKMPQFVYDDYPHSSWSALSKIRNKLYHGYEFIETDILYSAIDDYLRKDVEFFEEVEIDLKRRIEMMS